MMAQVFKHILFATDFSEQADRAFDTALSLARQNQAGLTVVHVLAPGLPRLPGREEPPATDQPGDDAEIARRLRSHLEQRYLPQEGVEMGLAVRRGHPSVEIIAEIEGCGADLAVLGSQGLSGMGLVILGSVADRVARKAPCSCLIVR